MTEANRLTHYRLFMTAFLWVNTILMRTRCTQRLLFMTAFLWVNIILNVGLKNQVMLFMTAFLWVNTILPTRLPRARLLFVVVFFAYNKDHYNLSYSFFKRCLIRLFTSSKKSLEHSSNASNLLVHAFVELSFVNL